MIISKFVMVKHNIEIDSNEKVNQEILDILRRLLKFKELVLIKRY